MSDIPVTPLTIVSECHDVCIAVRLAGSLDVDGAEKLDGELTPLVAQRPRVVALDLTDVDFAGSAALGAIVKATIRCRAYGGDLYLVNPRGRVRKALQLTRLTALFEIFESIDAAMA